MGWLTGYSYRKSVPLSRASGAVTDYQMKLLLGESAGLVLSQLKYTGLGASVSENPYDDEAWVSPTNIYADEGTYSSIVAATFDTNDYSQILKATTFGFGIPNGAVILGIKVEVEKYHANGNVRDNVVQLTKDGTTRVGDNKADTGTDFPAAATVSTYGSATDLWGTTWTAAEISAPTFGVHFVAKATGDDADAYVDYIRITVYYGPNVDCGGKIQSGFHDLAFTTSDGTTPLDYWIESITGISPNQLATVWIEFDSIEDTDTTFYMYYGNATLPDPIDVPTTCQWKRYPSNPILVVGAAGKWDDFWVQFNSIWKEGSTYYGYYQGCKDDALFKIGLATSTDGITWTKDTTADGKVLDVGAGGAWDDNLVGYPMVWKEGSTWYMLYSGKKASTGKSQIGLATSSDGITWTKDVSWTNPVITNGASLDTYIMQPGTTMLKEGSTYYFYYWGSTTYALSANTVIMLATSTDLVNWTKSGNNPMLSSGGAGTWDLSPLSPTVIKFGSTYYMWYEGACPTPGFGFSYVGLATSANKDSGWTRDPNNPVLGTGGGTAWDNSWSECGVLVNFGTEWRMYYGGSQGNAATPRCQSGFATYSKKGIGTDVFIVFDDFERVPFAAVGGNWTVITGAPIISLTESYGGTRSCKVPASADLTLPATASNNIAIRYHVWKANAANATLTHGNGTKCLQIRFRETEVIDFYSGSAYTSSGQSGTYGIWQILEIADIILGTSLDIWLNDIKIVNDGACNWTYAGYGNVLRFANATDLCYLDNVIVRNYRTTEPVWGSWGAETPQPVDMTVNASLQSGSKSLFSVSENTDQVLGQGLISKGGSLLSPSFVLDQILTQNLQTGSKTIFPASSITDQILSQNLLESITSILSVLVSIGKDVSVNLIPVAGSLYEVTVDTGAVTIIVNVGLLLAIGSALESLVQTDQVLIQDLIEKTGAVLTSSQNTDQILQQNMIAALGVALTSSQYFGMTIHLNALSALASIYQILVKILAAPENFGYLKLKLESPSALPEGDFSYEHSSLKMPDQGPEGDFRYKKVS